MIFLQLHPQYGTWPIRGLVSISEQKNKSANKTLNHAATVPDVTKPLTLQTQILDIADLAAAATSQGSPDNYFARIATTRTFCATTQ